MMNDRSATRGSAALDLFVASLVVLTQELALIRWLPGQVRVLAYFPNLILLSAFLGLGCGSLLAGKRSLLPMWPPVLLLTCLGAWFASGIAFTQESVSEHLWLLYFDLPEGAPIYPGVRLPIVGFFLLSALSFLPLGQLVAQRLQTLGSEGRSLFGYSLDLSGSLVGICLFTALSFLGTFPVVWFAAFLAAAAILLRKIGRAAVFLGAVMAAIVGTVALAEKAQIYSPYYAISVVEQKDLPGVAVLTNGSLHQHAFPLDRARDISNEINSSVRDGYHIPYRYLKEIPKRGLVLGAGTGNDVAVMLDEGVEKIDAVEIDPVILELGRRLHPNSPYSSPRVTTHNTDARSFLNDTNQTYDLIVFGTLDSMTRLSALSNVRLDNYVYSMESIEAARLRLAPNGGIVMYFMAGAPYLHHRLQSMLAQAFGEMPITVKRYYNLFNSLYMAGPAFSHIALDQRRHDYQAYEASSLPKLEIPTDDWPFLYLRERGISGFYLGLIAVLGAIALFAVLACSPEMRTLRSADVPMFLFGAAFLLLETKSVTEMSLIWGATWLTNAVVFGSILLMILIATLLSARRPLPLSIAGSGLIVTLALTYLAPMQSLVGLYVPMRLAGSILVVGAPIFFAGASFATIYGRRERVDLAFGWNLLGAVAGGLAEFLSMRIGLKSLLLVALAAYCAALALEGVRAGTARE